MDKENFSKIMNAGIRDRLKSLDTDEEQQEFLICWLLDKYYHIYMTKRLQLLRIKSIDALLQEVDTMLPQVFDLAPEAITKELENIE